MSFDVINGYTKQTWDDILAVMTDAINAQFNTDYTVDTIVGSNHFKFFYGGLQLVMETENKVAELGNKIADYIRTVNDSIAQPISSVDGTIRYFRDALGFNVALRAIDDVDDRGQPAICVDVDTARPDFESVKQQIFDAIHHSQTEGLYWFNSSTTPASNEYRGESSALNGQAFPYCFFVPENSIFKIRITVTRSRGSLDYQINAQQIADLFTQNFNSIYSLGKDFEGEKYLSTADISSASNVRVEWSTDDGASWSDSVKQMEFDEKITLGTIEVLEG